MCMHVRRGRSWLYYDGTRQARGRGLRTLAWLDCFFIIYYIIIPVGWEMKTIRRRYEADVDLHLHDLPYTWYIIR